MVGGDESGAAEAEVVEGRGGRGAREELHSASLLSFVANLTRVSLTRRLRRTAGGGS